MKYLMMIHHNEQTRAAWASYSDEQRAAGIRAHAALTEELIDSGELVLAEALSDPSQGRRVLARDGNAETTDGPFAEIKEHLAGFYLIECDTPDRAIEIAARIPEARHGTVEVRPVLSRNGVDM
jgi:hypothetical protein